MVNDNSEKLLSRKRHRRNYVTIWSQGEKIIKQVKQQRCLFRD